MDIIWNPDWTLLIFATHGPRPYSSEVHGLKAVPYTRELFVSLKVGGGILKIKGLVQGEKKNLKF
jgi:hypothetical protein